MLLRQFCISVVLLNWTLTLSNKFRNKCSGNMRIRIALVLLLYNIRICKHLFIYKRIMYIVNYFYLNIVKSKMNDF